MVPQNLQGLPQQTRMYGLRAGQPGTTDGPPAQQLYSIPFKKDNWTYFGQTGFPASAAQYRGQLTTYPALAYVNSQGGNNLGTASAGPAQRKTAGR